MIDSPRASKRRKVDVSPQASLRAGEAKNKSHGTRNPSQTPTRPSDRNARRSLHHTKAQEKPDVWDDFEGALRDAPFQGLSNRSPASSTNTPARLDDSTDVTTAPDMANGLHSQSTTPRRKRGKLSSSITNGIADASFRSLVNGFRSKDASGALMHDELAAATLSPTKRLSGTKPVRIGVDGGASMRAKKTLYSSPRSKVVNGTPKSARRSDAASKEGSVEKEKGEEQEKDDEEEKASSRPTRTRRLPARYMENATKIEIDNDNSGASNKRTSLPKPARRRTNRVDHDANRDDDVGKPDVVEPDSDLDLVQADDNQIIGFVHSGRVLDLTEPSPFNQPTNTLPRSTKEKPQPIFLDEALIASPRFHILQSIVLERIHGKRPAPLVDLDEEFKTVQQLVKHTVAAGEGNSLLLIGARGSGKTALINNVLHDIAKDNVEDYHVVRLNGFVHTDDKIALREIWRQLGREMDLEEENGGVGKNYADTLTTLLALLSHPSEQTGEVTDKIAKAVIFIMDEFDLFAQHPRQTLLYNLFDIAQSRKAPIAVLGLTTRVDVTNSLEKRVKSRFSHRYIHLSLAKTFTVFQEMCKANLTLQPGSLSLEEQSQLLITTHQATGKKSTGADSLGSWNASVDALFSSPSFLRNQLAPHFYHTKSIAAVLTNFLLPISTVAPKSSLLPSSALKPPDSRLFLLPHLSTLALALLIAAARLDIIHDADSCNFNMAYDEYINLASKARIQSAAGGSSASGSMSKVWGREVALREWQMLAELGLLMPVIGGAGAGVSWFSMVKVDVALEEIGGVLVGAKGLEKGLERWCRHL